MNWHLFIQIWSVLSVLFFGFFGIGFLIFAAESYQSKWRRMCWGFLSLAFFGAATLLVSAKVIWS